MARLNTLREPRLQTGPYLHDRKKKRMRQCKSRAGECVGTEMQIVLAYLSA
jgi:hypothetical protein